MLCSICLDVLQGPVATPCGHVFCRECLISSCQISSQDAKMAPCPTCRKDLSLVSPNAMFVPEKYRQFIDSSVRKIYVDNSAELALQERVTQLESRVSCLETQKDLLMGRCESYMQASSRHAENEKDMRTRCTVLQEELKKANQYVAELVNRLEARRMITEVKRDLTSHPTTKINLNSRVSSRVTSPSHQMKTRRQSNSLPTRKSALPDVGNRPINPPPKRPRVSPPLSPHIRDLVTRSTQIEGQ